MGAIIVQGLLICGLTITGSVYGAHTPAESTSAANSTVTDQQSIKAIDASFPSLIINPMTFDEPYDAGWQMYVDNDLFTGSDIDRDYTGGIAVAFSGRRAREWNFSLDSWLDRIDKLTGMQVLQFADDGFSRHTFEFGFVMLTPENITLTEAQTDDHPYGNFLFVANSQQVTFPEKGLILQSALTVGLIGTDAGPEIQNVIHSATGSEPAQGWNNQISEGGELTGRYSLMAQKNLVKTYAKYSYEISSVLEGNIGFNTDVAVSLAGRFGKLRSPWWSFVPHQSDYINLGQTITSRIDRRIMPAEIFGWAGVKGKFSAYNGFLQGQFRDSKVKYDSDELKHDVYEGWLGVTRTWKSGFGLSFFVRKRTGEIKGPGSRNPRWSGFIISFTS
ncbi:MAG: hypothetical protein ACI9XK_001709 [Granulosicoccus sp.]|jgi:hypothetical protein